jgi:hypothetical protein
MSSAPIMPNNPVLGLQTFHCLSFPLLVDRLEFLPDTLSQQLAIIYERREY